MQDMRNTIIAKLSAATLAVAFTVCAAGTASAAETSAPPSNLPAVTTSTNTSTTQVADLTTEEIKSADAFVTRSGDRYSFDKESAEAVLDPHVVAETERAINSWNTNVSTNSDSKSSQADDGIVLQRGDTIVTGPQGSVTSFWWGLKIQMDSYLAGKVAGGTATAAGIAAAIGLASSTTGVGGIAGAAVSTALGMAGGMLQLCRAADGSLTYYFTPVPPGGACNPFA